MQTVTVVPGNPRSARLDELAEPGVELGAVVVEALAVGVCGADAEIAGGTTIGEKAITNRNPRPRSASRRRHRRRAQEPGGVRHGERQSSPTGRPTCSPERTVLGSNNSSPVALDPMTSTMPRGPDDIKDVMEFQSP
jgi:hypothetical protein